MSGAPNRLPNITTSQGTTRIWFPPPGVSPNRNRKADVTHTSTYGVVYANDSARDLMLSKEAATFPAGSVIVREKLAHPAATTPDLLAVMIKREQGFNRKVGDWEFLIVSGDGKKIERREKKGECRRCHAKQAKSDFVFREPPP
jgi:hypothetical protein